WIDPQLLHARDQGGAFEAQADCCAIGTGDPALRLSKGAYDLIAVIRLTHLGHSRRLAIAAALADAHLQRPAVGQAARALADALQRANVPRPMPARALLHGRRGN